MGPPDIRGPRRHGPGTGEQPFGPERTGGHLGRASDALDVLPDVTVFGPYTYLVTEVAWGVVALVLLWRADAVRRAGVTLAVLYPVGYAWDRYTLAAGVFEIPLRTGIDLLGIPLEEHVFILVVPAMVIGVHETLARRQDWWVVADGTA